VKHLRKSGNLSAAAASVGVTRQALRHHVLKDPALMRLVKKPKK
jgi:hypothetical protein